MVSVANTAGSKRWLCVGDDVVDFCFDVVGDGMVRGGRADGDDGVNGGRYIDWTVGIAEKDGVDCDLEV